MNLKLSRYNFEVPSKDGILLYNAVRNGLALLDEEIQARYECLKASGCQNLDESDSFVIEMRKGGFLVEESLDEIGRLKQLSRFQRYLDDSVVASIMPTSACNMNCQYCYQKKESAIMSGKVEEATFRFISALFRQGTRHLQVTWYGGEPLLNIPTIERLSKQFMALCKERSVQYRAQIVTNGLLLNGDTAKKLHDLEVRWAQITLDGAASTHDTRRPRSNGGASFNDIMQNLAEACDHDIRIIIRVNVDRTNQAEAPQVLEELEKHGLKGKVYPYFAPVQPSTDYCVHVAPACFTKPEFARLQAVLQKEVTAKGFGLSYPHIAPVACGVLQKDTYVYGPTGLLYKCWHDANNEAEAVGNVFEPIRFSENLGKWAAWDVFEQEQCRDCKVLPICAGGCPSAWLRCAEDPTREAPCVTFRYNLPEMMKLVAASRIEKGA